jgi:putative transferase (TIGR04331 family)
MQHDVPTLHDLFATQSEIQQGHDFCKSFYYRVLPVLAGKLNEVHGVDLPVSFWKTSFGYWLYRHIAIVYEKYCYLSLINVDQTGIKLLDKRDFYVPQDHYHHIFCFACDFGVQQLVSHYYYLFKTKEFEVVRKQFCYNYQDQDNDALAETFRRHYARVERNRV